MVIEVLSVRMKWFLLYSFVLSFLAVFDGSVAGNVTYDGRSLVIDGQHRILFSGSIHYPRSTPQMWSYLISKAKEGGLDVIQTYVFWNLHEPKQVQYDFSGNKDLVGFIKEVQAQGLYVSLRIGPFIESEWSYGGLPFWLHDIPGIMYRTDNEPFKTQMQKFTKKIVDMMKAERLYASQGGPIILSQIENEYGSIERAFREKGQSYVRWAAQMAVGLQTGVPWLMCKQDDAPDPVINSCNGMRCGETFSGPNSPNKPALWTENWTSFYQVYGEEPYMRSAEDIAYHVILFIIAKKGSYVNYYMYHGGTNFGRTASAYMITGYYDQAPLDEYGLTRQPKWGHLKELHAAIKLCSKMLISGGQTVLALGQLQQAYVFGDYKSGQCAAFLVNKGSRDANVMFRRVLYQLPGKSISVLPDCKLEAFNTAKVNSQYGTRSMVPVENFNSAARWEQYREPVPSYGATSLRSNSLLEQTSTTKDESDYLWYTFRLRHKSPDAAATLSVESLAHVLRVFVNGEFVGSSHGAHNIGGFKLDSHITLRNGMNYISLLSEMVGLPDAGPYLESRVAGIRKVNVQGIDMSTYSWGYQVGLSGETLEIYSDAGSRRVRWSKFGDSPDRRTQPLTWYKVEFNAPQGSDPLALNLGSMGKGQAWINGQSIGRYWVSFHTSKGQPSQTWYHVPRSFLKPSGNSLVLLEEEDNVNPLRISLDRVLITKACAKVSEKHLPPVSSWAVQKQNDKTKHRVVKPSVRLNCPHGRRISKILFASFGTPSGDCQSYARGSCHASNSETIVKQACLGKTSCSIAASRRKFGDPCPGILKTLVVDAQCK